MVKTISRLMFLIHNRTLLKTVFRHPIKQTNNEIDKANAEANMILNYKFDCKKPRTFNEYLTWIKLFYRNLDWERCADKLGSKEFLRENGLSDYVVKTYKIYNDVSEIDLDELPEDFVLKTNNDSGTVFVCNKKETNFNIVFKQLKKSMEQDYSKTNGEWIYENIKPKIFAEELLKPKKGKMLVDYKFFAFNGSFGWGFTGQDRERDTRFVVFENDFAFQNVEYIYLRPRKKDLPYRPDDFKKMVAISERISKILDFVRVDFYDTSDGIKIGELTFFSQSGKGPFTKKEYDFKYGKLFEKTRLFLEVKK